MVRKFIVSQAKLSLLWRWVTGSFFKKLIQWGNPQKTTAWNAKVLPLQLSSLAVRIMVRSVIRRITASDDSCVHGGLHGYKATGHAQEKPNLPICACKIGDLEIII